jgi:hypothetical protein
MTSRYCVILVMISALILAGCQADTTPLDVANFSTNRAATQDNAAYSGMFSLYGDDSDKVTGPLLMSVHLNKGDVFGFEIDADHAPNAVAGKLKLQLQAGRYRWQMTADQGQVDWQKTNSIVLEVVIATAVVALAVVSTIVAVNGKL